MTCRLLIVKPLPEPAQIERPSERRPLDIDPTLSRRIDI